MAKTQTMQKATPERRVAKERSGWRDARLSQRHRQWGFHLPAVDLDFPLVEYTTSLPKAIVEYKHEYAAQVPPDSASLQALSVLGDWAGLPAFVVRYGDDLSWYRVRALNERGREMVPRAETMTEAEYVEFLHRLRRLPVPRREAG